MHNNQIKANFDKAAPTYGDNDWLQKTVANRLARLILEQNYSNILEIGAGTGNLTQYLIEKSDNILAVDLSFELLKIAKTKFPSCNYLVADADQLQFTDSYFDLITSSMCLQWLDLAKTMPLICSRSNNIALALPVKGSFDNWIKAYEQLNLIPSIIELYDAKQIKGWIEESGFKISHFEVTNHEIFYPQAIDFARSLKYLGANSSSHQALDFSLGKVIRSLKNGIHINNNILYIIACKSS